jgi:3-oxoacyl-[acyl-carrier-protein] synthase III
MPAYIHSFGTYIPPREISNEELSQFPPASLARIKIKTGVEKRRFSDGGFSSDLAARAAADCLSKNPFPRDSVDTVILATSTPDRMIPATAALVSERLNIKNAFAFDINSVCSGGLAALMLAASLVESGAAANVLVIAADVYSRILNPRDFSTYPYFGDGAAALIVSREKSGIKIGRSLFRSDGSGYGVITVKAGAAEIRPVDLKTPSDSYFSMNGREVFDFAVSRVPEVILHLMDRDGISMGEVRQFILHQANINIIEKISDVIGSDISMFFTNLQKYGNMAGASCLVALSEYLDSSPEIKDGFIILSSFGGGLSWGALSLEISGRCHG